MDYSQRHIQLNSQFKMGVETHLPESNIDIRFIKFQSTPNEILNDSNIIHPIDSSISENLVFEYPVFMPANPKRSDKAILLLHGLNERNWSKYLTWAEYLCKETGKPVILFPIAFHINRSPQSWSNPRQLREMLDMRRQRNGSDRFLSFANVSFSERITENPFRFYSSGRQSLHDLSSLTEQIKNGVHPLFNENTELDIFAYSIGAFLAEIIMMTNPKNLFSNSKLFLFCGGGVFSAMFGQSRCIMDRMAYEKLFDFYLHKFNTFLGQHTVHDAIFNSFKSMISPDQNKTERESFFSRISSSIKGVSLLRDKVMPYFGVEAALGTKTANERILKLDNSFDYTHENPFPVGENFSSKEVDASFNRIFAYAVDFLAS